MAAPVALALCFSAGVILRLALFRTSVAQWLALRSEISNPLTSWERASMRMAEHSSPPTPAQGRTSSMEGVALSDNMISPYSGDLFHETPLMLRVLSVLSKTFPNYINHVFVAVDVLCGLLLVKIGSYFSRYLLKKQIQDVDEYSSDSKKLILRMEDVENIQLLLVAVHFFNPFSVAVCLGKSTAVFNNLFVFSSFYFMLQGNELMCLIMIAIAGYQSLYPMMLLVPAALYFYVLKSPKSRHFFRPDSIVTYTKTVGFGLAAMVGLISISYVLEGSTKFLPSTLGFILSVPDLTPNLGVFWYFFTEMFEHFRSFFICVFQINAFLYTVPLAVKLRNNPVFLAYMLVMLMGIFKSYPSYADVGLYLTLLPMWKHVFSYMRNNFIVGNMFLCCMVISPILWHLWIYAGSANANFYFAIALTFSTAQIFLLTDLLYAFLRREYDLRNGVKQKSGADAQITLE